MKYIVIQYVIIIFLSVIIFVVLMCNNIGYNSNNSISKIFNLSFKYQWPVVGYTRITSEFGYRQAPTAGSSTYHSGIDIAAPTGSNLVSSINGVVEYVGFKGAGGHTIIISNGNIEVAYCHVDSNYYPKVGDIVSVGEVIGKVGPKYITDVPNNPYKDKTGQTTNGATTGPHLHFSIKIDGKYVNPLTYINV